MIKKVIPVILILMLAFALRSIMLTDIPPGLTHDEANHGWDSIKILDGVLLFYFPLNYGSEPLYNYLVAGSMALVGETLFALRLVNVYFGVLAVAAIYLWTKIVFSRKTAIVAAGLMSVSFWPLATSRQALRAGLLPFLATSAVIFFWLIVQWGRRHGAEKKSGVIHTNWLIVTGFSIAIAATLHDYLAARVLWLAFPAFMLYLIIFHSALFLKIWKLIVAGLVGAGLLVIPMFAYVQAHPEAETRLQMLDSSLNNLLSGNFSPILNNAREALLAFFWPGYGDHFIAYNIPGRPVLEAVTACFFLLGFFVILWRYKRPAYSFLLIWFLVGILPSLITGAEANTTRNIGALPPTYVMPAIGLVALNEFVFQRWRNSGKVIHWVIVTVWIVLVAVQASLDYFVHWSQSPDVRAAYQHTLTKELDYLEQIAGDEPIVLSSVYPGPAHDPSIARVLLSDNSKLLRWIDARLALLFPEGQSAYMLVPASTPPHPSLSPYMKEESLISVDQQDLDPAFSVFRLNPSKLVDGQLDFNFGNALTLFAAEWSSNPVSPGDTAELVTYWEVTDPKQVGPVVPPAYETDVVLFTHVLDTGGDILAQRDSLEAPSWSWQKGDIYIQIHPIHIAPDTSSGTYETAVGVYDRYSGERLVLIGDNGSIVDSSAFVVPLTIDE
jgi:4-amino-4-deoxy-L-arabinose transferase-like glycosyltransferase